MSKKGNVWVPWSFMLLRMPLSSFCIQIKSGSNRKYDLLGPLCPHFLSCRHNMLALYLTLNLPGLSCTVGPLEFCAHENHDGCK